jgi:anthranilate phosphoribosyltransferase
MRHVGPTRVELGTRTIFNLLGPLSNPAGVKRQLVGVFSPEWVEPLAHVLKGLGTEAAWVVHGDGLDELTTAGSTTVAELQDGEVRSFEITPEDVGLTRVAPADLKGGDAVRNAEALRAVLDGVKGPYRDIVLLNAGAAILVAGKAGSLQDGIAAAAASIDSGKARAALTRLAEISNRPG